MFHSARGFALTDPAGRVRVENAGLNPDGVRLCRVTSTGHRVDLAEEDAITILLPRSGRLRLRMGADEHLAGPSVAFLCAPGPRQTRVEAPGNGGLFRAGALVIPHLHGRIGGDPHRCPRGGVALGAGQEAVRELSDLLDHTLRRFDESGTAWSLRWAESLAAMLDDAIQAVLLEARFLPGSDSIPSLALARVRQAEEIMQARCDESLSIAAIAREVGVGLRCLQIAFLRTRGVSPRAVLGRMRLERAKERLVSPSEGDNVTSIALDSGFAHLSRFAGAYRRLYGEAPGTTLARARRKL